MPGPVRFVTAASLFDGHDASINMIRRLLQAEGAEVVHLGHNRSVAEVATAVLQEDVHGVAVSSYQGGHIEYFHYLIDELRAAGAGDVKVFGGGGGVIIPSEIAELQDYGVARIFSPADGQRLGLQGMIREMIHLADRNLVDPPTVDELLADAPRALSRMITALEAGAVADEVIEQIRAAAAATDHATLGITGTGGSGKSSLTDELIRRVRLDQEDKVRIAVLAIDPTRRRSGGALLGDRIRMNAIDGANVTYRSLATRGAAEIPGALDDMIAACQAAGYGLVIVETPGIGQGDAGVVDHVDVPLYVMTPEFGAASQLEKIDMLELASAIAINKFERRGGEDALRDVRRQVARSTGGAIGPDEAAVFGTIASRFNDDGVTALYQHLRGALAERTSLGLGPGVLEPVSVRQSSTADRSLIPPRRSRYLAEIADGVREYHAATEAQANAARHRQQLIAARDALVAAERATDDLDQLIAGADRAVSDDTRDLLASWPAVVADRAERTRESLSGTLVPRVAVPRYADDGALVRWLRAENVPGSFPFTGGVFPSRREDEDPTRMFAGEGDAFRTNRRFHLLAGEGPASRLSTAFDSVTLYGFDPTERPDVYGKVGTSGVSICTLDDIKALYDGFDLIDPSTSVSMTINGPAPTILAMFMNAAIDQHPELEPAEVLRRVRGTVQADILKEDQGQNTCIFSTEFALRCMADVQEWFVQHEVRNFYSVSISGYHIAEAGANPISQLAFTLANGFTYVEAYLARGMAIDDFAPNLSFFFSNGMDPEYTVLGRVARRIWAVAMRDRYGASTRGQKLKYHIQTSGRSLHAQEMSFNDIRTTLQALCAAYDNCNSLHTNAFDEAVTTPTGDSVRRAMAIQMIINREWGLSYNENPLQGAFIVDELTDLVEDAVLAELDAISERGGVLGAMETGYQRGRIQDDSMLYEHRKHDGSLPIVGVNTFVNPDGGESAVPGELARATEAEKESQLERLAAFHATHAPERDQMLARLSDVALAGGNVFDVLMDAVRVCSLGEITQTLFDVGGRYRRTV
jgi:methylmalonyl-CoA mutase